MPVFPDLGPKFRVVGLLGRGGIGTVYEAVHVPLRRTVAVKRIAAEFAARTESVERLRREAETAGRIGHPNIVQVVDFDIAPDGLPFLVMEKLEGETLRARLRSRGRLSASETVLVLRQICAALSATHAHGILHRDVKPENVFMARSEDGAETVKLLDFGLARPEQGPTLTVEGQFVGTPAYLAPEQVSGGRSTERTDVYATCLVGYECLCGARPFEARGLEAVLAAILELEPGRPTASGAAPDARPLDDIILRGLEKDPAKRWQSADALGAALGDALAGKHVRGLWTSRLGRMWRSRAGRLATIAIAAAGLLGVGAILRADPEGQRTDPLPKLHADVVRDLGCGEAGTARANTALGRALSRVRSVRRVEAAPTAGLRLESSCRAEKNSVVVRAVLRAASGRERAQTAVRSALPAGAAAGAVVELCARMGWEVPREAREAAVGSVPLEVEALVDRVSKTGFTLEAVLAGEALAREAVRRAPDHLPARIWLGWMLLRKPRFTRDHRLASVRESQRQAARALELGPDDPEAHRLVGILHYVMREDLDTLRELRWAERAGKADAQLHLYRARIAGWLGQHQAEVEEIGRCLEVEPENPECLGRRMYGHVLDQGPRALERALADRSAEPRLAVYERVHARALVGRVDEAALLYEAGLAGAGGTIDVVDRPFLEGLIAARRGDREAAMRSLRALEEIAREEDLTRNLATNACYQAAELSAVLSDRERVIVWAREGLARAFWNDDYWDKHFVFRAIRRDPRFAEIVREARRRGNERWEQARRLDLVD